MYVCRDVEEAIFMLSNSVLTGFRSLYLGQALTPDYWESTQCESHDVSDQFLPARNLFLYVDEIHHFPHV